jgi:hypothetical protein
MQNDNVIEEKTNVQKAEGISIQSTNEIMYGTNPEEIGQRETEEEERAIVNGSAETNQAPGEQDFIQVMVGDRNDIDNVILDTSAQNEDRRRSTRDSSGSEKRQVQVDQSIGGPPQHLTGCSFNEVNMRSLIMMCRGSTFLKGFHGCEEYSMTEWESGFVPEYPEGCAFVLLCTNGSEILLPFNPDFQVRLTAVGSATCFRSVKRRGDRVEYGVSFMGMKPGSNGKWYKLEAANNILKEMGVSLSSLPHEIMGEMIRFEKHQILECLFVAERRFIRAPKMIMRNSRGSAICVQLVDVRMDRPPAGYWWFSPELILTSPRVDEKWFQMGPLVTAVVYQTHRMGLTCIGPIVQSWNEKDYWGEGDTRGYSKRFRIALSNSFSPGFMYFFNNIVLALPGLSSYRRLHKDNWTIDLLDSLAVLKSAWGDLPERNDQMEILHALHHTVATPNNPVVMMDIPCYHRIVSDRIQLEGYNYAIGESAEGGILWRTDNTIVNLVHYALNTDAFGSDFKKREKWIVVHQYLVCVLYRVFLHTSMKVVDRNLDPRLSCVMEVLERGRDCKLAERPKTHIDWSIWDPVYTLYSLKFQLGREYRMLIDKLLGFFDDLVYSVVQLGDFQYLRSRHLRLMSSKKERIFKKGKKKYNANWIAKSYKFGEGDNDLRAPVVYGRKRKKIL